MNNYTEKYRKKLHELGWDEYYEYVEFVSKTQHKLRCKKCGSELMRCNDIFKGKTKRIKCRVCGNGRLIYSPLADDALKYYSQGHTCKETCEKYGVGLYQLKDWIKIRRVSNGRTTKEICSANGRAGNEKKRKDAETKLKRQLLENGFSYISGYEKSGSRVKVNHIACGTVFERRSESFIKYGYKCPFCEKAEQDQNKKEREEYRELVRAQKELEREQKRKEKDDERIRKFNSTYVCKCCGKSYTPKQYMDSCGLSLYSNIGYCSKTCKKNADRERKNVNRKRYKRVNDNHYRRALKLGLPAERGITLPKVIKRDGLNCAICGLPCFYFGDPRSDLYPSIDHIIPLHIGIIDGRGGHTWDNVQVAHRICNSVKGAQVGKRWNNAKK